MAEPKTLFMASLCIQKADELKKQGLYEDAIKYELDSHYSSTTICDLAGFISIIR